LAGSFKLFPAQWTFFPYILVTASVYTAHSPNPDRPLPQSSPLVLALRAAMPANGSEQQAVSGILGVEETAAEASGRRYKKNLVPLALRVEKLYAEIGQRS
jgi:hypothetical protein